MTLPNGEPLFKMRVKLAAVNLRIICEDAERGTEFFQINREWACEYLIFGPTADATSARQVRMSLLHESPEYLCSSSVPPDHGRRALGAGETCI